MLIGLILEGSPVADKLRQLVLEQEDIFEESAVETPETAVKQLALELVAEANEEEQYAYQMPYVAPTVESTPQKEHNNMSVSVVSDNVNKDLPLVLDSRDVAEMIGKRHDNLVRDIKRYVEVIDQSSNLRTANFFIESSYKNENNQSYTCYLLTRKGCDMVANKMTGDKGILFTSTYVTRFEEMEEQLKAPAIPMASYMIDNPI